MARKGLLSAQLTTPASAYTSQAEHDPDSNDCVALHEPPKIRCVAEFRNSGRKNGVGYVKTTKSIVLSEVRDKRTDVLETVSSCSVPQNEQRTDKRNRLRPPGGPARFSNTVVSYTNAD